MKANGKVLLVLGIAALVIAAGKEPAPPNPPPGNDEEPVEPVIPADEQEVDLIDNYPPDNITLTLPDSAIRPKDGSTVTQITYVK
jgi:hypothetical protein